MWQASTVFLFFRSAALRTSKELPPLFTIIVALRCTLATQTTLWVGYDEIQDLPLPRSNESGHCHTIMTTIGSLNRTQCSHTLHDVMPWLWVYSQVLLTVDRSGLLDKMSTAVENIDPIL